MIREGCENVVEHLFVDFRSGLSLQHIPAFILRTTIFTLCEVFWDAHTLQQTVRRISLLRTAYKEYKRSGVHSC